MRQHFPDLGDCEFEYVGDPAFEMDPCDLFQVLDRSDRVHKLLFREFFYSIRSDDEIGSRVLPIVVYDGSASRFLTFQYPAPRILGTISPYSCNFHRLLDKCIGETPTHCFIRVDAEKNKPIFWGRDLTEHVERVRDIPSNACCQTRRTELLILFGIPR